MHAYMHAYRHAHPYTPLTTLPLTQHEPPIPSPLSFAMTKSPVFRYTKLQRNVGRHHRGASPTPSQACTYAYMQLAASGGVQAAQNRSCVDRACIPHSIYPCVHSKLTRHFSLLKVWTALDSAAIETYKRVNVLGRVGCKRGETCMRCIVLGIDAAASASAASARLEKICRLRSNREKRSPCGFPKPS